MATGKGGYDYDFVTAPPKSLECSACLLTFRDPHVISCCGHEFCQLCIERVQRDRKPCPLCNDPNFTTFLHKKLVREVNALVVRCPQKEMGCEWEGELGQVEQHLNPGDEPSSTSGCGCMMVECRFQCGARLQRRLVGEHEMDICPKRPIEMQVASLMRKFEVITAENKILKQELVEVKKKNQYLQKSYDVLQKKQAAIKVDIDEQKLMCVSLQIHTTPLPVPPFYFTVSNMEHYKRNNMYYKSEPFYSHPGGYKMVVTAFPNGFGFNKGTHLFLGVAIQRGEFDDQLRWPFNGKVTIQVYSYTAKKWSNEKTVVLSKEASGLEFVQRSLSIQTCASWGLYDYLPLSELQRHYITKYSSVTRFRVLKVEI